MFWSMTARAQCTSVSTFFMCLDKMGTGLGIREMRFERVFVAGEARSLALAVVCERVLREGAESGTPADLVGLRRLSLVARHVIEMATGAIGSWVVCLVMERVTRDDAVSFVGGTLGRLGGLQRVCTLGTQTAMCDLVGVSEVAAVMSSSALRSVMSLVGAVMPLSAAAHAETACMSLSVGVREG